MRGVNDFDRFSLHLRIGARRPRTDAENELNLTRGVARILTYHRLKSKTAPGLEIFIAHCAHGSKKTRSGSQVSVVHGRTSALEDHQRFPAFIELRPLVLVLFLLFMLHDSGLQNA